MRGPNTWFIVFIGFGAGVLMPLFIAQLYPQFTNYLFFAGPVSAFLILRTLYRIRENQSQAPQDEQPQQQSSRILYISLLDELGHPLPPQQAQARLEHAKREAAPQDKVIGVYKPVNELNQQAPQP
jgi:hypothetical protein